MELAESSHVGITQSRKSDAQSRLKLVIHNQCPSTELISPLYYSDGAECHLSSSQRVDAGSTMQTYLRIDLSQDEFICALLYKLKRKNTDEVNETTYTQLAMIWKIDKSKRFHLIPHLIEHDKGRVWDEDRRMRLAQACTLSSIPSNSVEDTWLMHDDVVLMIRMNVTYETECYKLETTISETTIKDDTRRPWYFDVDR
jgi:hypothetical protein